MTKSPKRYQVIDNLLPEEEFKRIQRYITGTQIPWSFQDGISLRKSEKGVNNYHFCIIIWDASQLRLYDDKQLLASCMPIIEAIGTCSQVLRLKLNCSPATGEGKIVSGFHTDTNVHNLTGVFYYNTCNGGTVLRLPDGDQLIEQVENRLVVFPSNTLHASCTTTDSKARFLLNLNWLTPSTDPEIIAQQKYDLDEELVDSEDVALKF